MELFSKEQLEKWGIVDYGITTNASAHSFSNYHSWVEKKWHLPLLYLEGERRDKRENIKFYWENFNTAIVFLFSYHSTHQGLQKIYQDEDWNGLKVASYTLGFEGLDYHHLLKERLNEIGCYLQSSISGLEYKLTLDTHPVMDRDLAFRAGLGWFGKNSMLINPKQGSFFIIGSILLNRPLELKEKKMETDHCGQCQACVDACPTEAIDPETRTIKANQCISTFTIEEFKLETKPSEKMDLKSGWIFGCDICQDVCPWNKRIDRQTTFPHNFNSGQKKITDFFLKKKKEDLLLTLENMSEGEFRRTFKGTSFERSGRRGLLKNIRLFFLKIDSYRKLK